MEMGIGALISMPSSDRLRHDCARLLIVKEYQNIQCALETSRTASSEKYSAL